MKKNLLFPTLTATFLLFSAVSSPGQNDNYMLKLQTGIISTQANLENFETQIDGQEAVNGYYYRIIQFYEVPFQKQKDNLASEGIILMDYLPDFAFVAAIPVHTTKSAFRENNVRSVLKFQPEMKISVNLAPMPDHAVRNNNFVELEVSIHSNIELDFAAERLRTLGYKVTGTRDFGKLVTVIIDQNKITEVAALPYIYFIEAVAPPPVPDDARARSLHRVNTIQAEFPGGRNYTGAGVTVAIADDGAIGPHIDFTGRVTQFTTAPGGTHGDMTAGIMVGAGNLDPANAGSAPGAHINMYSITGYNHIVDAVANYNTLSTVITSTSYSQGSGGVYNTSAQAIDEQIRTNPQLIHVFSAGNAGSNWSTITGGYKAAKSVIACGNLNGYDALENSSSRGPAQDGRIKPDICANGASQMSTDPDNAYSPGGGTSAASPSVAAVVTCLYEAYKTLNGVSNPPSALIKAAMLNSAEDLGNPGPDFQHGWGRVNAFRALTTLEENRYLSASVDQGDSNMHVIEVPPGVAELRVMVYWPDYEGSPAASKALVNDLNILLTTPAGLDFEPWVLNPSSPGAVAVRGIDDLNPVEQVTLDNPTTGNYLLKVTGFAVPQGPQTYYLVYEFRTDSMIVSYPSGGEGFVPGIQEHIRWEAHGNTDPFSIEYSVNDGNTWLSVANNVISNTRYYSWTVPTNITPEARVRVTRNGISGMSQENFTIVGRPQNINFISACPDSVELGWTSVNGATGYEVSRLGAMYLDSIAYTTSTTIKVAGTNPFEESWYSVRAIMANGNKGRRANAVYKSPGIINCVLAYDAEIFLLSPTGGTVFDCQNMSSQEVSVTITNGGANPLSNVPVFYSINGGVPVSEIYTGTIPPGANFNYTFTTTINLTQPGTFELLAWVTYPGDNNIYNDSTLTTITVINGIVVSLPWTEDFESFGLCSTAGGCETVSCNLANGFLNQPNNETDNIDWRVNSGTTPSTGTGPTSDHTTGNSSGKYLYLEATTCFQREAHLTTPCIDLTTASMPVLYFWYHMNGVNMGNLHVDALHNGTWTPNAMTPISGNQGNSWQQASVNLSAFTGSIITIRFRGITGPGFESDVAIDDINLIELSAPPVAAFSSNLTLTCPGQDVILTDLSLNSPVQWLWNITPSTYTFINGTSDTSQHPQIQFNAPGIYDITLTASNSFGSNSSVQSSYITVVSGASLPITEDFQLPAFPPDFWSIVDPGGSHTWQHSTNITGADGNPTLASRINNFNYNNTGAEDRLNTLSITVPSATISYLTFDVAYARYSATYIDSLRIDISTDCAESYTPTGYIKGGISLATSPDQTTNFFPSDASQWRKDTLWLSTFAGNDVVISFVNINGFGNSLYIDNINVDFVTSVKENLVLNSDVQIFPNPSNGSINLNLINLTGEIKLEIIDARGRIVMHDTFINNSSVFLKNIELNQLPGVYFVKINSDAGSLIRKLILY